MTLTAAAVERRDVVDKEEKTLSPTIAVTWPNFVSRKELDVHFKDFEGRIQGIIQRVSRVETQNADVGTEVRELGGICREQLASKQMLSAVDSRLALDLAICQKEIEEGLEEQRSSSAQDVAAARAEFGQSLSVLQSGLRGAVQDLVTLDTGLKQQAATTYSTYATKVNVDIQCEQLRAEQEAARSDLDVSLETIRAVKASRNDLHDVRVALEESLANTRAALATIGNRLDETREDIVQLRRHCQEKLASQNALDDLDRDVKDVQASSKAFTKECNTLRGDVDWDRDKLLKGLEQQREQGDHLRTSFRNIRDLDGHLSSLIADVTTKCDKLTQELGQLEERHQKELQQCHQQSAMHRQAHATLKESHETLDKRFLSHTEAQKNESESLRHYSTHHFIEQMDKALKIQQSVNKIEKGHVELNEAVRTIKLPKV